MAQAAPFRSVPQPKRTRVLNVKQSKGGCNTCKARRVKCDETKPKCQRCERVDRHCEYASKRTVLSATTPSSSSLSSSGSDNPAFSPQLPNDIDYLGRNSSDPSPSYAITDVVWRNPEQSRLANLGCWVLSNDPIVDKIAGANTTLWLDLLPQLVRSTRIAHSAAAAFGAVYESCLLPNEGAVHERTAATIYSNALCDLQEGLTDRSIGTAPLLLACILLACVEVVQRRRGNALTHLEGAFKVLEISDNSDRTCRTPPTPASSDSSSDISLLSASSIPHKDDLYLLLKSLDLQTSTYALSRQPALPPTPNDDTEFEFNALSGADLQLIICLHNVHHFTSTACTMKYFPPSQIPREMSIEQGRYIARLSLWLKCLDENVLRHDHTLPPSSYRHALMLRAQCLIAIVYASTILCPYETEYDRHASLFQQIIEAAAVIIDAKTESGVKFRPGLGIIQPLLFTAVKYRHSWWRRKAINLMQRAGVEGPWVGFIEAAVAERVMDIEQETCDEPHDEITPKMIPERKRVCGQNLTHDEYEIGDTSHRLRIQLSRCVDVEYMISGKEPFENAKHWNIWQEEVDLEEGVQGLPVQRNTWVGV